MHTYAARLGMFLLLSSVVAGCAAKAGENPLPEYRGTMRSSCAPHDAPSTELRLEAAEGKVWVYFNLWPTEGVNPPSTVRFDTDRPIGQGAYCIGPETCETAEWGEVVFVSASPNADVHGEWTLGMPDGRVHRGAFEADWLAIQALCG